MKTLAVNVTTGPSVVVYSRLWTTVFGEFVMDRRGRSQGVSATLSESRRVEPNVFNPSLISLNSESSS